MLSCAVKRWPAPNYCQKLSSRRGLPRRPSRLAQRNLRGVTPLAGAFSSRGKRRAALLSPREAGLQLRQRVVRRSRLCTRRSKPETLALLNDVVAASHRSRSAMCLGQRQSVNSPTVRACQACAMRHVPRAPLAAHAGATAMPRVDNTPGM
jgi:hypothetical protein